ncbi:isopentenyl-diphosphate Delta-isomerase [Collinsella sp. LCP19S3_C9]|uniref:isopentenyl-diphosphate Delta-isomerase n=1 Tax=Collinsella sp. LCP19S3_C9 TaxID=3438760 RepID=UPI003F8FB612
MGVHTTKIAVGEGKFALMAQLTVTPRDMAVYACSPEFAHLGATAQAIPRPEPGRIEAHAGEGILHQAFLTLLVEGRGEDARLLLCRRSPLKRLWGGVLADSCAGHPLPGEDVAAATARRINEELGITREPDQLEHLGHVVYREDHGDGRCECEWCEVYLAHVEPGELHINQEEISEVRRVAPSELDGYLQGHPEQLAPWLREALEAPPFALPSRCDKGAVRLSHSMPYKLAISASF